MDENSKESRPTYPCGTRIYLYEHLLRILYQQNKISKNTYIKASAYVERIIDKKITR